jgi:hypothetical protein
VLILLVICILTISSSTLLAYEEYEIAVNRSTIYEVNDDSISTTTLNNLQIIFHHKVTDNTGIYLNGTKVSIDMLCPRDQITVVYNALDKERTAYFIIAYRT